MNFNFGTIGAGTIGQGIARHLTAAGNQVVLSNSRGPATPGARVVKAFNTLYAKYIVPDPRHTEGRQLLFYAGDDAAAKQVFRQVADSIGFAPADAGTLRDGGRLMQVGGGPLSALHALRQD